MELFDSQTTDFYAHKEYYSKPLLLSCNLLLYKGNIDKIAANAVGATLKCKNQALLLKPLIDMSTAADDKTKSATSNLSSFDDE